MTKSKIDKLLAVIVAILAVLSLVLGGMNLPKQTGSAGTKILDELRIKTLLNATGDSVVESYVDVAKKEATKKAKEEGGGMSAIRDAVAKAEEETRAKYADGVGADLTGIDTTNLSAAVTAYTDAVKAFADEEQKARSAYEKEHYAEAEAALEAKHQEMLDAGEEIPEDEQVVVDMSGFEATAEMNTLEEAATAAYSSVGDELKVIYPVLTDDALETLQETVQGILYQSGDKFDTQYDRYVSQSNSKVGVSDRIIRHGDDLIFLGVALLVVVALLLYRGWMITKFGVPRVIIGVFFILLCFMTLWYDLSLSTLLSNTIVRMGMNSIMVLAMVPGIQCGISLNLGLPIGLVAGLIGGLVTIEMGIPGWAGFFFAIVVGSVIAAVCGYLYGLMLNRLKGEEMGVTTYVGFSIVSLMCIAWLVLPFKSLKLRWPLGTGLRNTIGLDNTNFRHILNDFLSFKIGSFVVPTGLLLFMVLACLLVWLFSRSKTGQAMQAVGNNPRFAEATGINVDKMRIIGTVLSTVIGAIGILVYSQSYGFMQLYTAPRQMGFIAASAILIGGASTSRCKISHVLIGTFLFQGVLTLGMPVANVLVPGSTISETLRILISNGIILYALTKSGGDSRA